ncbi:type II toxin-antitoxin system RelE/ParE family toxin [Candidatus Microgenomates bacterium]|nr:type II toxin-antitoxin system RelE/ParE family toxin [Candidatus Microgenomates bacterium]
MNRKKFHSDFRLVSTKTFDKCRKKECQKHSPGLAKKLIKAIKDLKKDPFQGKRVEHSGERRIWVGTSHRLFYDIEGKNIVLLGLRKKSKKTYKD